MRDIGIYLREHIGGKELIDFLVGQGGVLSRLGGSDQVIFETEQGRIYVSGDTELDQAAYDESELDELTLQLGFLPHACVSIHIGSGGDSLRLAQRVADKVLTLTDGCVDYDGVAGGLGSPPAGWNEGPG